MKVGTPPGERIDKALTPYAVLGIPRDASSEKIRAAYSELSKKFYRDAHAGDARAEHRFLRIQSAYIQLNTSDPMFSVYKATDATSHRHALWLVLIIFVLTPAAVLLGTYGLRDAPGPMPVKADIETISDSSPKTEYASGDNPTAAPPQSVMPESSLSRQEIAVAEPKPDIDIVPQNTPQPIGVTFQAEHAGSGQRGQKGRADPADPPFTPGSIAGARHREISGGAGTAYPLRPVRARTCLGRTCGFARRHRTWTIANRQGWARQPARDRPLGVGAVTSNRFRKTLRISRSQHGRVATAYHRKPTFKRLAKRSKNGRINILMFLSMLR